MAGEEELGPTMKQMTADEFASFDERLDLHLEGLIGVLSQVERTSAISMVVHMVRSLTAQMYMADAVATRKILEATTNLNDPMFPKDRRDEEMKKYSKACQELFSSMDTLMDHREAVSEGTAVVN